MSELTRQEKMAKLRELKVSYKGNASNETLEELLKEAQGETKLQPSYVGIGENVDNLSDVVEIAKEDRNVTDAPRQVNITNEDIFDLLNSRLPEKGALSSLAPKGTEQAIGALSNVLNAIEGDSNNIKVAKNKIEVAINLLRTESKQEKK